MMRPQWVLAVALTVVLPLSEGCTGMYTRVSLKGPPWGIATPVTCTYLCPQKQQETFQAARKECLADGADLTTINSEFELKTIIAYGRTFVWIGLVLADDDNWQYIDGSTKGYIRWANNFPDANANKKCVGVTPQGMVNVLCSDTGNFLCERGLCQEHGGKCVNRKKHCCKEKMIDSINQCSGDHSMICCEDFGERGGGLYLHPVKKRQCSKAHQVCMCQVKEKYIRKGGDANKFTPAYYITHGCSDRSPLPLSHGCDSSGNGTTCIKKRILNLLKCFSNTCDQKLTVTGMLRDEEFPDDMNFCDGKCIRIVVPSACNLGPLRQMCTDVMGVHKEKFSNVTSKMYFTCCYNRSFLA